MDLRQFLDKFRQHFFENFASSSFEKRGFQQQNFAIKVPGHPQQLRVLFEINMH